MKRLPIYVVLIAMCVVLQGCTTLGIPIPGTNPDKLEQQQAIEGAAIAGYLAYRNMDHDVGNHVDHLRMTLQVADDYIARLYPQHPEWNWSYLIEARLKDATGGKWNIAVAQLYNLLFLIMDDIVEDEPEVEAIE